MKPLILKSELSKEPIYYVTSAYKIRPGGLVVVTGKKHDVTDQILAIIEQAKK